MTNKEEEALKEWEKEIRTEVEKLEKERLSEQIAITRKKLEILRSIKGRVKGDVYGEKFWEAEVKDFKQILEEKQMRHGRLYLLKKLIDRLDDIP